MVMRTPPHRGILSESQTFTASKHIVYSQRTLRRTKSSTSSGLVLRFSPFASERRENIENAPTCRTTGG